MSLTLSPHASRKAAGFLDPDLAFGDLPPGARVLSGVVIGAAALVLAAALLRITPSNPLLFIVLLLLSGIAAMLRVVTPAAGEGTSVSLASAVDFAALLLLGPAAAVTTAACSSLVQCTIGEPRQQRLHRTALSVAAAVLAVQVAGLVYEALGGLPLLHASGPLRGAERAIVAGAATHYLLNVGIVLGTVMASREGELPAGWKETLLWSGLGFSVGAGAATVCILLAPGAGVWLTPLVTVPVFLVYRAHQVYAGRTRQFADEMSELTELHLGTIEALALAIDAKDHAGTSHLRRVQIFAAGLAEGLGLPPAEIQGVRTAALLHDIGKLAVPEHILSKPGPLTGEEFQKIQVHPQVGAEIIAHVPFPYPVAPLILAHHERWDGKGYPNGTRGEQIPLGARILHVVDYFDALTSDRPYHQPMDRAAALEALQAEAGKALDPEVVALFVELLPQLEQRASRLGEPSRRLSFAAPDGRPSSRQPGMPSNVFQDIALAHREVAALYEIAQSMGTSLGVSDTMALVASKLTNLVPFSSCALFLHAEGDTLRCRFASGVDAEALQQLSIPNGSGIVGWVGRNRRPLVNARPAADFELGGRPVTTSLQSALVCPLVFSDRLIGALALYHVTPAFFTDDHRRLLDRICEQAAGVVHNSVLYEQTKQESLTDPLTGLPNTRFMFVHLSRELARAERLASEVSLLVMDLDGFKEINDRYGHHVGDRALREVARVLRGGIRPYDICVRYAGDEFVVVLSGCGPDEAAIKKLELQQAIADIPFEVRPGLMVRLGSSFGCASFPRDGGNHEALLAIADTRMYEDKAGRKRAAASSGPETAADAGRVKRPSVFAKIRPHSASSRPH